MRLHGSGLQALLEENRDRKYLANSQPLVYSRRLALQQEFDQRFSF